VIWIFSIGLSLVVGFYLAAPFLAKESAASPTNEIEAYRNELRAIERSEDPETAKKAILQKLHRLISKAFCRVLKLASRKTRMMPWGGPFTGAR